MLKNNSCNVTFQALNWVQQPEFSSTDQPPEKMYHHQKVGTQICQHICAAETNGSQHWIVIRFATLSSCRALAFNPWKRNISGISSCLCIWMLQSQNNNLFWSTGHILRCPRAFLSYRHWVVISKWQNRNKTIYPHVLVCLQSRPDRYLALGAASLRLLNHWMSKVALYI